jgi:hypothetical protein
MKYSFDYPQTVRELNGRRRGSFMLNEEHIAQTHAELMSRLDDSRRTITVQTTVDATAERVWAVTGSPERLFSHQPRFAGLTSYGLLTGREGGHYVIHRVHDGKVYNRIGEILVDLAGFQLTVSDIDIDDPTVSGKFPSLFTVRVEEDEDDPERSTVQVCYTTLGVVPPLMPAVLLLQLRSIQERAEEASQPAR